MGLGGLSGCSNQAHWIRQITAFSDSIIVQVGPEEGGPTFTCAMLIQPIDVVRIPRTVKPVFFRSSGLGRKLPEAARWWDQFTRKELEKIKPAEQQIFYMALARDPATPSGQLTRIAERIGVNDWEIARVLLERSEIQADPTALAALMDVGDQGERAGGLLIRQFGVQLAGKKSTTPDILRILIEELKRDTIYPEIGRLLIANPTVRHSQDLLQVFTRYGHRYQKVHSEACRLYAAQWPVWEPIRDVHGKPVGGWYSTVPCSDLPKPPNR